MLTLSQVCKVSIQPILSNTALVQDGFLLLNKQTCEMVRHTSVVQPNKSTVDLDIGVCAFFVRRSFMLYSQQRKQFCSLLSPLPASRAVIFCVLRGLRYISAAQYRTLYKRDGLQFLHFVSRKYSTILEARDRSAFLVVNPCGLQKTNSAASEPKQSSLSTHSSTSMRAKP